MPGRPSASPAYLAWCDLPLAARSADRASDSRVPACRPSADKLARPLRLTLVGYLGQWREVPPDLVSSSRCAVLVAGGFVACRSPDGWHPWPGGRLDRERPPSRPLVARYWRRPATRSWRQTLSRWGCCTTDTLAWTHEQAPTPTSCRWSTSDTTSGAPGRKARSTRPPRFRPLRSGPSACPTAPPRHDMWPTPGR